MKQKYFLRNVSAILFILTSIVSWSQTTIVSEDFETDGSGGVRYTISNEFNDGSNDHFGRTDGSDVSGGYNGQNGSFFIAGEDLDDNGGDGSSVKTILLNVIDITGYSDLKIKVLAAAGSAAATGWDSSDVLRIEYSSDGTNFFTGLQFSAPESGSNKGINFDTNNDGTGDGSALTNTFAEFQQNIPVTGSTLYLKLYAKANSGREQFAIDNIRLDGTASSSDPSITFDSSSSSETETDATFNTSIPITLSNYDADVTVSVTVDGSSTAEAGDYTLNTSTLAFSSNGTQNISLDINNDADSDDETVILNIAVSSGTADLGVSSHTVTITDDDLPSANISYNEGFSDCSTHDWTVATVGAETEWICGSGYFEANAWGSSGTADDYLISPSFNMDTQTNEILSFNSLTQYADTSPQISLLYTTNYTGDPSTTTWVSSLSPTWPGSNSNVSTSSGNIDISSISGTAVHFAFRYTSTGTGSGSTEKWRIDDISIGGTLSVTDDQTIASDINLDVVISSTGSLTLNSNSDINGDVTIADGGELTLNGSGTISGSVTITNGGSLIATDGSVTGNITFNRTLTTENWYLMSSPVVGETYDNAYVTANGIASGTQNTNSRGIALYTTSNDSWDYMQAGETATFSDGTGYSVKRSSSGTVSFTGTLNVDNAGVDVVLSSDGNRLNLLGNPYTSHIASATFLANEGAVSETQTLWVWDEGSGSGAYEVKTLADAMVIAPTQGFFVKANAAGGTFNFSESNQASSGGTFQRTVTRPEIYLTISDQTDAREAKIYYIENMTTGFDVGYEGELFNGVSNPLAIYTHLVADSEGKNYQVQSLPPNNYENMVVPVGINAEAGTAITIDAATNNFPEGINIYLEDKQDNTFTLLEADANFSFTPENNLSGIGRFYLHTTSSVLSADDFATNNNISIYTSSNDNLRIVGVQNGTATVQLYNILGKEVLKTSFEGNGVNDINLNTIPMGIYIVKIATKNGTLNRKIIIQ